MENYKKKNQLKSQVKTWNGILELNLLLMECKKTYFQKGDKVTVKGTGKARKQTATWY